MLTRLINSNQVIKVSADRVDVINGLNWFVDWYVRSFTKFIVLSLTSKINHEINKKSKQFKHDNINGAITFIGIMVTKLGY